MKKIGFMLLFFLTTSACSEPEAKTEHSVQKPSFYAGQEKRGIKSLSPGEIKGLLAGSGTPFGGMAKLAELNGYPGPRHVLDLADDMNLSDEQVGQIRAIYDQMKNDAVELGKQIIAIEKKMNDAFADRMISEKVLQSQIKESADVYAQLRFVHLRAHLQMDTILSKEQRAKYDQLRGYSTAAGVPAGHDPEMWKKHNGS